MDAQIEKILQTLQIIGKLEKDNGFIRFSKEEERGVYLYKGRVKCLIKFDQSIIL